jgi:hypothetical protein
MSLPSYLTKPKLQARVWCGPSHVRFPANYSEVISANFI